MIEVGLPYSDPVMDGPTIQAAAERALVGRASARATCFRTVEAVAATGVPTLVMTYWNPSSGTASSASPPTWPRPAEPG